MEVKEIKIKYQGKLTEATIEVVNGVMIVSPKEEKVDITKFKDGDVITCGHYDCDGFQWTAILKGEIEYISDNMFIDDYCSLDCEGEFLDHNSGSDSATLVRYATEEEKRKLFDKLKEEGLEFDFEKKEIVKLRWELKHNEYYWCPSWFYSDGVVPFLAQWSNSKTDNIYQNKGWIFKTEEECEQFCAKLNKEIECVKP